MDSNCRYPANFFGAPSDPHAIRLPQHKPASLATGTDGSNLSPSSGDLVRTLLPLRTSLMAALASGRELARAYKPYIETCVVAFGPDRG